MQVIIAHPSERVPSAERPIDLRKGHLTIEYATG